MLLGALAAAICDELGQSFVAAVDAIRAARGRVIVTGIGKSGHVARKIAATFASTGTPAQFVHPAEASHGDLGMIAANDAMLALSNSIGPWMRSSTRVVPPGTRKRTARGI